MTKNPLTPHRSAAATKFFKRKAADIGRLEWALEHVKLDGESFSLVGHEYLREIYLDTHPYIVIEKAAQTGGSSFGIIDLLWGLNTGQFRKSIYFFPTATDVRTFSADRIKPMILDSPLLSSRILKVDNVEHKQFVDPETKKLIGSALFRGMKSRVATSNVDADHLVIDERDKVNVKDYELAMKRISHSKQGLIREACTPTVPDYGIDATFLQSDQRYWHMECPACGTDNQPETTFREDKGPGRVLYENDDTAYLGCKECTAPLDTQVGRWIAHAPQNTRIRGYHLSQLYSSIVSQRGSAQDIILTDWNNARYIEDFWNSRIGFPYEDATTALTREMLNVCDGDYDSPPYAVGCTMGVDQGKKLHVVVSDHSKPPLRKVVFVGVLDGGGQFSELDALMKRYDIRTCVIDALPNQHDAKAFAARYPGRVYRCFYQGMKGKQVWNDDEYQVNVDRTLELDASVLSYARQMVRIPRMPITQDEGQDGFKSQMCNMARTPEKDENGDITGYKWVKRGADHFRHADNYDQIAASRRGRAIQEIIKDISSSKPRQATTMHGSTVSSNRSSGSGSRVASKMGKDWF